MYDYKSQPTLTDVAFTNNSTTFNGGAMYEDSSVPTLTNITFSANSASQYGGGMYNYRTSPVLTNVTFSGNSAEPGGGGGSLYDSISDPHIYDSIFWKNGTEIEGGDSTFIIADSLITGGLPHWCNLHWDASDREPAAWSTRKQWRFHKNDGARSRQSAIDAGNNSTCASTDQRGVHRPRVYAVTWAPMKLAI